MLYRGGGGTQLRIQLSERAVPLVGVYDSTLFREDGAVVYNVCTAQFVAYAGPTDNLDIASETSTPASVAGVVRKPDTGSIGIM